MKITITVDDELFAQALEFADPSLNKPSKIFQEALKTFVRVEAAKRLAAMGGVSPDLLSTGKSTIFNEIHK